MVIDENTASWLTNHHLMWYEPCRGLVRREDRGRGSVQGDAAKKMRNV
jgi:hypothetical protein